MLRLLKLTDYAFIIMAYLAQRGVDAAFSASNIAHNTHLPAATVKKILKRLAAAQLVLSQRGAVGGYRLAAKPEQINMAQIIMAMELNPSLTACTSKDEHCWRAGFCTMHLNWILINQKLVDLFQNISLRAFISNPKTVALNFKKP